MKTDIYGELIPDRINTEETDIEIAYPEQLIITFESVNTPTIANVMTSIRTHILESKKQGVQPDIVLNFCIGVFTGINSSESDMYIQNFITLAEYIQDIRKIDPSIKVTISVRGIFLKSMLPLAYIGIPIKVSRFTYIESYSGDTVNYDYQNCLETFIESTGVQIKRPLVINKELLLQQKLIQQ